MLQMYDLAGADPQLRFSPYCWRTRFALAHKGLPVETLPWRFTEKSRLPPGQEKVPVLLDGPRVVGDSWAIADHLERTYPDRPSLFAGEGGQALARFVNAWADTIVLPAIFRMIVADIPRCLAPQDLDYFRVSREARLGMTLEQAQADRAQRLEVFRALLAPVRRVLETHDWLGGDRPSYADHILAGTLMWPRCVSDFTLLVAGDPVSAWFSRALDLYDGLGRSARTSSME
jgi:glutathione S-transferase